MSNIAEKLEVWLGEVNQIIRPNGWIKASDHSKLLEKLSEILKEEVTVKPEVASLIIDGLGQLVVKSDLGGTMASIQTKAILDSVDLDLYNQYQIAVGEQ